MLDPRLLELLGWQDSGMRNSIPFFRRRQEQPFLCFRFFLLGIACRYPTSVDLAIAGQPGAKRFERTVPLRTSILLENLRRFRSDAATFVTSLRSFPSPSPGLAFLVPLPHCTVHAASTSTEPNPRPPLFDQDDPNRPNSLARSIISEELASSFPVPLQLETVPSER
jgi:hypothetical protein